MQKCYTIRDRRCNGKDTFSSWIKALACTLMTFIVVGISRGNGLLFVALMEQTYISREMASWPLAGAAVVLIAPLTGILATHLSARMICFYGSALSFVGITVCYFSTNFYVVVILYGFCNACGLTMVATMLPSIINENFKLHRASALGLATSGPPLGTFVFTVVMKHSLEIYALRGTFLLLGGISLHSFIGVALLFPKLQRFNSRKSSSKSLPNGSSNHIKRLANSQKLTSYNTLSRTSIPETSSSNDSDSSMLPSIRSISGIADKVVVPNSVGAIQNKDSVPIPQRKLAISMDLFKHICVSPYFYLIALSEISIMNLMETFTLVIIDYTKDKGVSDDQAYLMLIVFSIGEIFGRNGLGWITDKGFLSRQTYVSCLMFVSGSALIALTFGKVLWLQMFLTVTVGVAQGALTSIIVVVLNDYLRKEAVTLAFGLSRSMAGLVILLRVPVIGYFRDTRGSYDAMFQLLGAIIVWTAFLWFIERLVFKYKLRRSLRKFGHILGHKKLFNHKLIRLN